VFFVRIPEAAEPEEEAAKKSLMDRAMAAYHRK
jgi:hypothetical protein